LPLAIKQSLKNLDVIIEEWPAPDETQDLEPDYILFGMYTGVPLTEREGSITELPDRISIYRQPILRHCSTRIQVEKEIRTTLWHEVGHYLGLGEDDLHRLGYG